ncbi:hypothetical protein KC345_g4052 [Hortaea werneckii]|nr:hypothetical protein KC345_g4052 [Hortaea werneckii]
MAPKKRKAEADHGSRKKQATETPSTRRITRGMTTDAARRAVFETAELLENIVMQLPPRKIFVIQRVCKQFRDIVATSVKIQQRLFLRADGFETPKWRVAAKANADAPNDRWQRTYRFVKSTYIAEADENLGAAFRTVRLGHALKLDNLKLYSAPSTASLVYAAAGKWVYFRREMIFCGESALAETYLTHPPTQQTTLEVTPRNKSDSGIRYMGDVEVSNPDGLKVADIQQAIQCSEYLSIRRPGTATHDAELFSHVSLQDVTGDQNFLDQMEVDWESASIRFYGYIVPTEEEWAEMTE